MQSAFQPRPQERGQEQEQRKCKRPLHLPSAASNQAPLPPPTGVALKFRRAIGSHQLLPCTCCSIRLWRTKNQEALMEPIQWTSPPPAVHRLHRPCTPAQTTITSQMCSVCRLATDATQCACHACLFSWSRPPILLSTPVCAHPLFNACPSAFYFLTRRVRRMSRSRTRESGRRNKRFFRPSSNTKLLGPGGPLLCLGLSHAAVDPSRHPRYSCPTRRKEY